MVASKECGKKQEGRERGEEDERGGKGSFGPQEECRPSARVIGGFFPIAQKT